LQNFENNSDVSANLAYSRFSSVAMATAIDVTENPWLHDVMITTVKSNVDSVV